MKIELTKQDVILQEYNPNWIKVYAEEKNRIVNVIGEKINGIEHIGSTSIKGLIAKPIIDILVGVNNLAEITTLKIPLSNIEYEYVPKPEIRDRIFFRKGMWGRGICHLHICEFNGSEWCDKLLFRDYLRSDQKAAYEYAQLKMKLAATYQFDRQAYTMKKEPFIREMVEKARKKWL